MTGNISVATLEAAAEAEYAPATAASAGLTPFLDNTGAQLTVDAGGCIGSAWRDGSGNVIIAFQGTTGDAQTLADTQLLSGSALTPALAAASGFARDVMSAAATDGIAGTSVFVTGHSLGGVLAEAAAAGTGLAGASFAGAGLPGYTTPASGPATDFVSYVESGDPFANFGSDTAESAIVGAGQDHYGTVVQLGSPSATPAAIVDGVHGLFGAFLRNTVAEASASLEAEWHAGMSAAHGLGVYGGAIAALPAAEQVIGYGAAAPAATASAPEGLIARVDAALALLGHGSS